MGGGGRAGGLAEGGRFCIGDVGGDFGAAAKRASGDSVEHTDASGDLCGNQPVRRVPHEDVIDAIVCVLRLVSSTNNIKSECTSRHP